MATAMVTPPMRKKADALVSQLPTFNRGRSKVNGRAFFIVPGSKAGTAHWTAVDGSGCTCVGYQRRGTCTHSIAARTLLDQQMRESREQAAAAAPKTRRTYAELNPVCAEPGCDDDALRCGFCLGHRKPAEDSPFVNGRIGCEDIFQLNPLAE